LLLQRSEFRVEFESLFDYLSLPPLRVYLSKMDDVNSTLSILFHLLGGGMVLLLSLYYLHINRVAASRDAIAYAEKMRMKETEKPSSIDRVEDDKITTTTTKSKTATENESPIEEKKSTVEDPKKKDKAPSDEEEEEEDLFAMNNNWRCACENGFLPPGMLGGAEAVFRMGVGDCYHKR
jgi:hypothetical protein